MPETPKCLHGGARSGAGRPSTPWRSVSLRLDPDAILWTDTLTRTDYVKGGRSSIIRLAMRLLRATIEDPCAVGSICEILPVTHEKNRLQMTYELLNQLDE